MLLRNAQIAFGVLVLLALPASAATIESESLLFAYAVPAETVDLPAGNDVTATLSSFYGWNGSVSRSLNVIDGSFTLPIRVDMAAAVECLADTCPPLYLYSDDVLYLCLPPELSGAVPYRAALSGSGDDLLIGLRLDTPDYGVLSSFQIPGGAYDFSISDILAPDDNSLGVAAVELGLGLALTGGSFVPDGTNVVVSGYSVELGPPASVPEPGTLIPVLLVIGIGSAIRRRRSAPAYRWP